MAKFYFKKVDSTMFPNYSTLTGIHVTHINGVYFKKHLNLRIRTVTLRSDFLGCLRALECSIERTSCLAS